MEKKEFLTPNTHTKKNSDILFINVPSSFQQGLIPDDEEPPFGLLRLGVVLEKNGFNPTILDAHRGKLNPSDVKDVIYDLKPQSIGLNPTSVNLNEAAEIAEIAATKGIPIIIGGVHATLSPQQALKDLPMVDIAIRGRGEIPLIKLLRELRNRPEIQGVYYNPNDISSQRTDYAQPYPIEEIPPIDYRIWVANPLQNKTVNFGTQQIQLKEISVFETVGCPFECTYCSTPVLVGRKQGYKPYTRPSTEKIVRDVSLALETGANAIHFVDDMAFISPRDFRDFFELWQSQNLPPFYWRGMTRAPIIAERFTDDDLKLLAESGCWRLAIGVESGNQQMLDRIKKRITLEQVRTAVERLRQAGIPQVKAFFIMGFPDETLEQMQDTQRFILELKQLGLTDISLFQFKPYPGTEEWEYLRRHKPWILEKINYRKSDLNQYINATGIWLPDHLQIAQIPSGEVRQLIEQTLELFYS